MLKQTALKYVDEFCIVPRLWGYSTPVLRVPLSLILFEYITAIYRFVIIIIKFKKVACHTKLCFIT